MPDRVDTSRVSWRRFWHSVVVALAARRVCQAACLFGRSLKITCEHSHRRHTAWWSDADLTPIRTHGLQLAARLMMATGAHGVTHSFVNYSLICMLSAAKQIAAESRKWFTGAQHFSLKAFPLKKGFCGTFSLPSALAESLVEWYLEFGSPGINEKFHAQISFEFKGALVALDA